MDTNDKALNWEPYDFGTPGATEDSRPIGYAECRYCKQSGWWGQSIQHAPDCVMSKLWKRAHKLRRKK